MRRAAGPAARSAPYLGRALRSGVYGVIIGVAIALLRRQSVPDTIIYSVGIALLCWFFIDMGRRLVVAWLYPSRRAESAGTRPGWPGAGWMIAVVLVGSMLGFTGGSELGDLLTGGRSLYFFSKADPRDIIGDLMFVVVPAVVITYFFYSREVLAEREASAQAARRQAAESRLRLLEAQLEPHMFFNTLANLHVLIGVDPPRAQAMLDQLISFLRATLNGSRASEQPLSAEFARIRDYLSLMQVRMEDRLRIGFELPESLAAIPVPPLLLQPLVENSIKHGLEPSVTGGLIDVRASRDGAYLVLRVRDTGVGLGNETRTGTHFGLQQVRERLETLYGSNASLRLEPAGDDEGGTLAIIRLPAPGT